MALVRVLVRLVVLAAVVLSLNRPAETAPIQGPGGQFYEFVSGDFTWAAARTLALGSSHLGQPGHLATVTSAAENAFLLGLNPLGWLGGSDQASDGTWRWIDGAEANQVFWNGGPGGSAPPGVFANWGPGQPDAGVIQNFLLLGPAGWDDFDGAQGYFAELPSAVPEPATLLLVGTTMAGVGLARLRRRRQEQL